MFGSYKHSSYLCNELFEAVKMQQTKAVRSFLYRYPFWFSLTEKFVVEWIVGIFSLSLQQITEKRFRNPLEINKYDKKKKNDTQKKGHFAERK